MFSKDIISQSIIDAVSNVLNLDEKIDIKKRTTDTLAGRVKIPPTAGDNEHTDYKVELNAEETDKGESSTDAKGNKTTKYKDGSWQTETPTHKDDGKNPEGKVHHLSDVARRKMIKMNANNEEVELDEVLDTRKSIKSYLDKNDAQRTTLKASGTFDKVKKRLTGANKALDKLSKLNREEVELDEDSDEKIARVPKSKRFIYGHKVSFHAHGKDIVGDVSSSTSTHAKVSVDKPEKGDPHNWNVPHKHLTLVHDYNKAYDKAREQYNLNKQQKEEVELEEKLNIQNTAMGDIIKDFQTSDAPQFAGKSQAKRRQMAIAAKMATEEYLDEENAVDKVTMDVPLLIRIMEYSKEDAKSDMDLHKVAEKLTELSASGKTLSMDCYNEIVGGIAEGIMKSLGRGLQGWSKGDKAITGTANSPRDIVIRNKGYDNETTKMLHKTSGGPEHSPAGLQKRVLDREMKKRGIAEAKRPEDDSVPFITNEDGLAGHVDNIKKTVKHHFKKLKAHGDADVKESYVEESGHTERKKSFVNMLDRISAKAKENTKLQQNRKIDPKLPKKDLEESEKPTTAHFTDPKGIKRKQPNDPFYPEYDKHEQGKTSDAKKARFAKSGLKAEEVIDEAKKDSYQIYHPTYSSAVQHAEKHLNKQGFDIHPDDWFHHVNSGPSKPAEGKTVSLHIPLHKDGVPSKKVAHIQVYNRGNDLANNHELNMYHN